MTALEILRAARAKVEQGWTQGARAATDGREEVSPLSPFATCFCSLGAIDAVCRLDFAFMVDEYARNAYAQLRRAACGDEGTWPGGLSNWNDTPGRTKAEVLDAFDRAIAAAEAKP